MRFSTQPGVADSSVAAFRSGSLRLIGAVVPLSLVGGFAVFLLVARWARGSWIRRCGLGLRLVILTGGGCGYYCGVDWWLVEGWRNGY